MTLSAISGAFDVGPPGELVKLLLDALSCNNKPALAEQRSTWFPFRDVQTHMKRDEAWWTTGGVLSEWKTCNLVFSKVILGYHSFLLITSALLIAVLKERMSATWCCLHLTFIGVQEFKKHKRCKKRITLGQISGKLSCYWLNLCRFWCRFLIVMTKEVLRCHRRCVIAGLTWTFSRFSSLFSVPVGFLPAEGQS